MAARKRSAAAAASFRPNGQDDASSFVGRADDLVAIAERLDRARLVTILGPGGIGKTRLALRAAANEAAAKRHPGGVWFCDLTEARHTTDIARAVASTLGVRFFEGDRDLRDMHDDARAMIAEVGAALEHRGRLVLVLDNLEHLTGDARTAVHAWLGAAAGARFLTTSRVSLDLPGEDVWPLPPLPATDAANLFLARARQVRPDLRTTDADLASVAAIVQTLEGMPLAIELAASRMEIMSPAQLSERLGRPLDLLSRPRDPGRHASMRRTVLDSVQLLDAGDRAAFVACAVFRDGFTLEAAEAVIGARALDRLATLARSSLVRAVPAPATDAVRFSLFVTIREVASELFAADPERDALAQRHAAYYAAHATKLRAAAETASTRDRARTQLGLDLDNFLAAYERSFGQTAIAIALGLEPLLALRGLTHLRLRLLGGAIDALPADDDETHAEALVAHGQAKREVADFPGARRDFARAMEIFDGATTRSPKLTQMAALAHARMGELVELTGATADAHVHFSRALSLLGAAGLAANARADAEVRIRIAHAYRREGKLAAGREAIDEAIARYRTLHDDEGLAEALYEAAAIALFQGSTKAALGHFDEGLALARRAAAPLLVGTFMTARASLLQGLGEQAIDEAIAEHAAAATLFRELGSRYSETSALYYLGTAHLECGELEAAMTALRAARDGVQAVGSPHYEALVESAMALAFSLDGQMDRWTSAFERAEAAAATCASEPALGAAVRIHGASLRLRALDGTTDDATWTDARARALEEADALVTAHSNDDSHFARRMLLVTAKAAPPMARSVLVVAADGSSFRPPGARAPVDVSTRPLLQRILALLIERRLAAGPAAAAAPVTIDAIVDAAWPGERMAPDAATNRVHVALATLRKLGLRDALKSGNGSYWLDPSLPVRVAVATD